MVPTKPGLWGSLREVRLSRVHPHPRCHQGSRSRSCFGLARQARREFIYHDRAIMSQTRKWKSSAAQIIVIMKSTRIFAAVRLPPCNVQPQSKTHRKTPVPCPMNEPLHPARVPNEKVMTCETPKLAKTQANMLSCARHGGGGQAGCPSTGW
jgi:hypothetical protein